MRTANRKPGKFSQIQLDPILTSQKFLELEKELEKLKRIKPQAAAEVARLAELGDFSENVEYQMAKGKLRGINNKILQLEDQLHQAVVLKKQEQTDVVQLGNFVTIICNGKEKRYQLLGSVETNPKQGVISHNSPIGAAIMGRQVGDLVIVKLVDREMACKILKIE